MTKAFDYVAQVLAVLPGMIATGIEVTSFIQKASTKANAFQSEKRQPTSEEWDELNAYIAQLRGVVHAPTAMREGDGVPQAGVEDPKA
jgi:hypothetical protein